MLKVVLKAPKSGDFRTDMSNTCHYVFIEKNACLFVLLVEKQADYLEGLIWLNVKKNFIGFSDGLIVEIHLPVDNIIIST